MFKKFAFTICCATKLVALTCSNPVTLSAPGQDCDRSKVAINENGDIGAIWNVEDDVSDDEYVYTAVKKKNGEWGPSSLFAKNNDWIRVKKFQIDSSSNLQAVLQLDRDALDDLYLWSEKKWGDSLPTAIAYPQPFPVRWWEKSLIEDGKWIFLEEVPGVSSNSKKLVVASVIPGQTEITRAVIAQFEGGVYGKKIIFDSHKRAIAVWQESTYDVKSYKTIYTLKIAREKEDGTWTPPETVSTEFNDTDLEKIGVDLQGNVVLALEKNEELYAMIQENGKWSTPIMIAPSEQEPENPRLTFDKEGNLLATWKGEIAKKRVIYAAYKPVGKSWQPSVLISPDNANSFFYKIKADNRGSFTLVWEQRITKKSSAIYGTTFSTQSEKWSKPVQLSPAGQNCLIRDFALSGNGKGALAWLLIDKCCNNFVQVADLLVD